MPLTRELEHFLHCIATRAAPRTSGEEAISVLRILTAGSVIHD
jgi:predicted dehydrogenase